MPKVSVIVPVYNTENYLETCLNSIFSQTLDDIEILIVDDGSSDNSKNIIKKFEQSYPNIIKYFKKKNGGLSDTRNYAIPYSTGEYISFIDSDDYIDKYMLEKMYTLAKQKDLDLVECNFIWEYPNKYKIDIGKKYASKSSYFIDGRVMACNKLFKASIIKDNNIMFPISLRYEDIEFFYKLVPYIKKYDLIEIPFYHYVQRNNSIINDQNEKTADIFIILKNIIDFYKSHKLFEEYKEELEYLYIRFLLGSSFLRIVKIKNKNIRKKLLSKTIYELYLNFPNWKQNNLLKIRTKKNMYYKTINKYTFKLYSFVFKFIS